MPYPAAGVSGQVMNGSNTIANLDKWQIQQKAATKDSTAFGASGSWQINTTTLKSWTAKSNGRVDPSDTNGQLALLNGLGSTFTVKLYIDGTRYWSGTAILSGIDPADDVNDLATIQYSWTGTGACTLT